jgi:hypothetical protein
MEVEQLYEAIRNLTLAARAKVHTLIALQAAPVGRHVQWLVEWKAARDAACDAPDNGDEEKTLMDTAHGLSILLASTSARSTADMIAQIEWFKEDLVWYVLGNASVAHDSIFETLSQSAQNIGA